MEEMALILGQIEEVAMQPIENPFGGVEMESISSKNTAHMHA